MSKCFLRHDWSKWEQYDVDYKKNGKIMVKEIRQRRKCKNCGKTQDKEIDTIC